MHSDAPAAAATDWRQIVALYDQLAVLAPGPVVALNRAVAVAEVDGPAAALALVDALDLDGYYLLHAIRGDLLRRLGPVPEAGAAYDAAIARTENEAERDFLRAARAALPAPAAGGPGGAAAKGVCRGRYQISRQPAARQRTHRWPCPGSRTASGQSHGIHPTVIRPGPHG